jgi:DNA invertase Pin-like site-specific DNA recombinase
VINVSIYARFSDDIQNPSSIEDQVRTCKEKAKRENWNVVQVYSDAAISGFSILLRPGIQQLVKDAKEGKFEFILAEGLDRISRDQEDVAGLFKRITFAGVKIMTLQEGIITPLHIGFKGTMNAIFLDDLKLKVKRGQRGRVESGKMGGGNCYGYDVSKNLDSRGEIIRGERTINLEHARIVERIFKEYAAGKSPKAIAHNLNAEKIAGPTAKGWGPSTIYGSWQRGAGILNNELYIGQIVWNKVSYPKNPETGKHVTRNNPASEWIRKEVPELRIIAQELWDKVKARQKRSRVSHKKFWQHQRPRLPFSYLLKCGCCGGGVSKLSTHLYACSTARYKGESVCSNRRSIRQDELESTVLDILQTRLMDPKLAEVFCREYTQHLNRLRMNRMRPSRDTGASLSA